MKAVLLLIKLAWRGDLKLWQVFWIGKILIPCLIFLVLQLIADGFDTNWPSMIYGLLWPFYLIFIFVAVWRCAPNTDHKIWMYLVRAQIILLLVSVILMVAFLLFDAQ
jgi:hypothetical protein